MWTASTLGDDELAYKWHVLPMSFSTFCCWCCGPVWQSVITPPDNRTHNRVNFYSIPDMPLWLPYFGPFMAQKMLSASIHGEPIAGQDLPLDK